MSIQTNVPFRSQAIGIGSYLSTRNNTATEHIRGDSSIHSNEEKIVFNDNYRLASTHSNFLALKNEKVKSEVNLNKRNADSQSIRSIRSLQKANSDFNLDGGSIKDKRVDNLVVQSVQKPLMVDASTQTEGSPLMFEIGLSAKSLESVSPTLKAALLPGHQLCQHCGTTIPPAFLSNIVANPTSVYGSQQLLTRRPTSSSVGNTKSDAIEHPQALSRTLTSHTTKSDHSISSASSPVQNTANSNNNNSNTRKHSIPASIASNSSNVKDVNMALKFESLLTQNNETKKLTSTPDRLKSIEDRKVDKLQARSAIAEKDSDASLLEMIRGLDELAENKEKIRSKNKDTQKEKEKETITESVSTEKKVAEKQGRWGLFNIRQNSVKHIGKDENTDSCSSASDSRDKGLDNSTSNLDRSISSKSLPKSRFNTSGIPSPALVLGYCNNFNFVDRAEIDHENESELSNHSVGSNLEIELKDGTNTGSHIVPYFMRVEEAKTENEEIVGTLFQGYSNILNHDNGNNKDNQWPTLEGRAVEEEEEEEENNSNKIKSSLELLKLDFEVSRTNNKDNTSINNLQDILRVGLDDNSKSGSITAKTRNQFAKFSRLWSSDNDTDNFLNTNEVRTDKKDKLENDSEYIEPVVKQAPVVVTPQVKTEKSLNKNEDELDSDDDELFTSVYGKKKHKSQDMSLADFLRSYDPNEEEQVSPSRPQVEETKTKWSTNMKLKMFRKGNN